MQTTIGKIKTKGNGIRKERCLLDWLLTEGKTRQQSIQYVDQENALILPHVECINQQ